MNRLPRRLAAAWVATTTTMARRDDRGAMTVETAILTALLGIVATGFVAFVTTRVTGWEAKIPTP
jgi:Flp pilus assembly protein TadG